MEVQFSTDQLEKCFRREARGRRAWGEAVARRYIQRIQIIQAAKTLADLYAVPSLRFHVLKGDREGQYAMTLTGYWRLIVTVPGESGSSVVRVEEVSKHYDD